MPYCYNEYYKLSKVTSNDISARGKIIWIRNTLSPTLVFSQKAKVEFQEFLCYIASIVSLWFGVSLIMIKDWLKCTFNFLKTTYNNVNHVTNNNKVVVFINRQVNNVKRIGPKRVAVTNKK